MSDSCILKDLNIERSRVLHNFEINCNNIDAIDKDLFSKIYFNLDDEYKLRYFPPFTWNPRTTTKNQKIFREKLIQLISFDVAQDLLSIDIGTIQNIPKEFISEKNAIAAMDKSIYYLRFVPGVYQTQKYQQKFVEKYPMHIDLISPEALTDETIKKAVSIRSNAFEKVPIERRTKDICEFVLLIDPSQIKNVPDDIRQGLENKLVNKETQDYKTTRLESINGLLREKVLNILVHNGIITVGDLFDCYENNYLQNIVPFGGSYYQEIISVIRLLKCMFFGMNPEVDFNSTGRDFYDSLGFTKTVSGYLVRAGYDKYKFLDLIYEPDFEKKLLEVRFLGVRDAREIARKTSIILNYYNNLLHLQENISDCSSTRSLDDLLDDFYSDSTNATICYGGIKQKKL